MIEGGKACADVCWLEKSCRGGSRTAQERPRIRSGVTAIEDGGREIMTCRAIRRRNSMIMKGRHSGLDPESLLSGEGEDLVGVRLPRGGLTTDSLPPLAPTQPPPSTGEERDTPSPPCKGWARSRAVSPPCQRGAGGNPPGGREWPARTFIGGKILVGAVREPSKRDPGSSPG
jgi:hypothetical protein